MPLTLSGNGTISDLASAPTVGGTALPTTSDLPTLSTLGIANHNNISVDSSGRMTNSNQPSFVAHMIYQGAYNSVAEGSAIPYDTTYRNVGSCFNTANYTFTAPITGSYLFSASVITNSDPGGERPCFYINGGSQTHGLQYLVSHGNIMVAVIPLSINDYVFVASQNGPKNFYGNTHSQFSGILIA